MSFDVTLVGGMPWGFRIHGGIDCEKPVHISRVNPVSKASQAGLQEGDFIESINGQPTAQLQNREAHQLIKSTLDRLDLSIRRAKRKSEPLSTKMFRSSTNIEVNTPTSETPGDTSGETLTTIPQSPHSTTIILNPIHAGFKSSSRKSSEEVVVDGEPNGSIDKASTNEDSTSSGAPARQADFDATGNTSKNGHFSHPPSSESSFKPADSSFMDHPTTESTVRRSHTLNTEGVWTPGSSPTTPRTILKTVPKTEDTSEAGTIPSVWKPFGQGSSPEKHQFKSVKIDPSAYAKPSERIDTQENGTTYPPPPLFANTSPPEEDPCVAGIRPPPPVVPPKTLSFRQPDTIDTISTAPVIPSAYGSTVLTPDKSPPSFTRVNPSGTRLPTYQNPTITLLQKAREGQIPKGAVYIDHKMNSKEEQQPLSRTVGPGNWWEPQFAIKSEEVLDDRKVIQLEPVKFEGIGPVIKGIPIALCTGVKDENKAEWYKRMYKSLHRGQDSDGRMPYLSRGGYMSEPEPERDDDYYYRKYATLDRRKTRDNYYDSNLRNGKQPSVWSPPSARYSSDIYKNQPKKIEDYEPGHSSIAEMEAKLQGTRNNNPPVNRSSHGYMFKDGYESDSTLVYRKKGPHSSLSPNEQHAWYKEFQKGGDIPLTGFRRPAPEKPAEPPHRYQASEVNIHYRSPIQNLEKEYVNEDEIRRRQEQMMKEFYEEEKHKKAMQELADIESRRHSDNFIPSQKSPIPLNRYDNLFEERPQSPLRARTPEPKTAAKALYNFTAQSAKELSFNKGDIIFIHRKIDKNWYEGEHHGLIGLFPVNHVEIIPYDSARLTAKKATEGQARAKYNFQAQTPMELSLVKGEHVILTRKVDSNWYEGRIGSLKGIFPTSYIDVLVEPGIDLQGMRHSPVSKPVASPVSHSLIMNGSSVSPKYNSVPNSQSAYCQRIEMCSTNPYATMRRYGPTRPPEPWFEDKKHPLNETLHIQTQSDPIPRYRALYAYKPQNDDELELREGDTVYVMEKCDDGWYVGSSQRTGLFGTFPGNYVERI